MLRAVRLACRTFRSHAVLTSTNVQLTAVRLNRVIAGGAGRAVFESGVGCETEAGRCAIAALACQLLNALAFHLVVSFETSTKCSKVNGSSSEIVTQPIGPTLCITFAGFVLGTVGANTDRFWNVVHKLEG